MSNQDVKLHNTMDAKVWAAEFIKIWGNRMNEVDEELMFTWFANSIMCGWDHSNWDTTRRVTKEELLQAFGLAYTTDTNKTKVLDSEIAIEVANIIFKTY